MSETKQTVVNKSIELIIFLKSAGLNRDLDAERATLEGKDTTK